MTDMGTVHELLEARGKQEALLSGLDRGEIEAAAAYMSDEESGVGFLYSGWCQAALPHRKLPDTEGWQITGERVTLVVEPGMRSGADGRPTHVGVPYGSRARLVMFYLQSEALRTRCREVELGSSLRAWLTRLGIPIGGKSVDAVRYQAERISRCKLTFEVKTGASKRLMNQSIVDTALFLALDYEAQGSYSSNEPISARASSTSYSSTPCRWRTAQSGPSTAIPWHSTFTPGSLTASMPFKSPHRSLGGR